MIDSANKPFDAEMPERTHLYQDANGIWSAFPDKGTEYIRADLCVPQDVLRQVAYALKEAGQIIDGEFNGENYITKEALALIQPHLKESHE